MKKYVPEGGFIPFFYAIAYRDWDTEMSVAYPIPVHLFVRIYRDFVLWAREWWRPSYCDKAEITAFHKGHDAGYALGYRRGEEDYKESILADIAARREARRLDD